MGKICIIGLALAISKLDTTDLPERSHQPGSDFLFPKRSFGRNVSFQDLTNTLVFQSGLFFTTMRLRTLLSAMFKEKKNKTSTKADPAFVSSA